MKGILKSMIFFRKKKPTPPEKPTPVKKTGPKKAPSPSASKPLRSLQEIAHTRVLTAEGWRRLMEKKPKETLPAQKK